MSEVLRFLLSAGLFGLAVVTGWVISSIARMPEFGEYL